MDNHGKELVETIRVLRLVTGIGQAQLEREWYPIKELGVSTESLLILEPLEMEREDVGKSFDFHPTVSSVGRRRTSFQLLVDHSTSRKKTCSFDRASQTWKIV